MPNLAIAVPTLRTLPTVTVTIVVSVTAMIGGVETIQAGMQTPAAAVSTMSAGYSWEEGDDLGREITARAEPAFSWLTLINGEHPAWESDGGPLWAIWPAIWGLLPLFLIAIIVALIALIILIINWLITLFDIIIKIIELIPGM
jgi:hypothetical protein